MKDSPYETMIPECMPAEGLALIAGSKVYATRTDRRKLFVDAVGVDIEAGEGVDLVHDLETPFGSPRCSFAHIDCVSVLEHIRRPWLAAKNLQAVLKSGGTICVSVPLAWRIHGYPSDYWRMTPDALSVLFDEIDWTHLYYYSQRDGLSKKYPKPTPNAPFLIPRCETFGWGVKR